jgi:hypothetical protein
MMAIVQKKMGIYRPIYEMLQLVNISLTEKTPLDKLLGKPNYNIINERDGSSKPTCFKCLTYNNRPQLLVDTHEKK